ncbi:MAG: exodeoxyribonuclease VII small subunit [Deltaproteobacteria bacterium]|jgi:exodeoxyribonuclease VII small subunit|nr:exodeoxyribonuclease VII small subunit [Deltaproteobacteria bacterium]
MSVKVKNAENPDSFEAGLEKLQKIVDSLGQPDFSLDEAIASYEQGVALGRALADKLAAAEARLEKLSKGIKGELETSPLAGYDGADEDDKYDEDDDDEDDDGE